MVDVKRNILLRKRRSDKELLLINGFKNGTISKQCQSWTKPFDKRKEKPCVKDNNYVIRIYLCGARGGLN